MTDLRSEPHVRFNPLRDQWVLVSPQRNARPWQGHVERTPPEDAPAHDPSCYLCPGAARAGGAANPEYTTTFVFDNDFPALRPAASRESLNDSSLLIARGESGRCRVVCFSPRHDLTLSRMDRPSLRGVVDAWIHETAALSADPAINYVQVFENRGAAMGASNPHPHGQIWATATVPNEPAAEQERLLAYQRERGRCLICDYAALEIDRGERLVCENDGFVAMVPFWATWPFETLVVARRHMPGLAALEPAERDSLADVLKRITTRYDNIFEMPFPYSMGFHQAPADGIPHDEWHLHAHFYPPLLRSATVRKFMVGFEMLGSPQRDVTPEDAAARIRSMSERHYRD